MAHIENRNEYKSELCDMLARNGVTRALTREYDEIANMCHMLKRPLANCASLIMRLEMAAGQLAFVGGQHVATVAPLPQPGR